MQKTRADQSISDWQDWEQDIADILIIKYYLHKDPKGLIGFSPKDLQPYHSAYRRTRAERGRVNKSVRETINKGLQAFVKKGELDNPTRGAYRLNPDGLLFIYLKICHLENQIDQLQNSHA